MPAMNPKWVTDFRLCLVHKRRPLGYVFIPKCGSTSIKVAFGQTEGSHYLRPEREAKKIVQVFADREVFTVLRNPITRAVSAFMEANNARPHLKGSREHRVLWSIANRPLKAFAYYLDLIERVWFDPHALPQRHFVVSPGVRIDRFFAFETMDTKLRAYLSQYGVELPQKRYQRTRKAERANVIKNHLREPNELRTRVERLYANDIALYEQTIGATPWKV